VAASRDRRGPCKQESCDENSNLRLRSHGVRRHGVRRANGYESDLIFTIEHLDTSKPDDHAHRVCKWRRRCNRSVHAVERQHCRCRSTSLDRHDRSGRHGWNGRDERHRSSAGTATGSAGTATGSAGTATGSTGTATGSAGTATGSAGTATGSSGTAGTVSGTAGVPPVGAGATGTTATGSPTTGAPSSPSAAGTATSGYRLTGADMRPFLGQRVQLVGMFAPTTATSPSGVSGTAGTSGTAAGSATSGSPAPMPEFRVVSIRPIGGSCQ
jgi:hypothetical protein